MFDTNVTIIGNVVTAPEWRRTDRTKTLVAHFKVASTARRFDKENNRWTDGNSLRVRVTCWRGLAAGVGSSLSVGDPVVVVGRMYTRDWLNEEQQHRVSYELEAVAVGHDLARGVGTFQRRKPSATVAVEDAEAEERINGELTSPVPSLNAGRSTGDPDDYQDDFDAFPLSGPGGADDSGSVDDATQREALEILRGAGLEARALDEEPDAGTPDAAAGEEADEAEDEAALTAAGGRARRRSRQAVSA